MEALLRVENLGKRFGGFVALESIDLDVTPGERLGLIGPNGSGKSTLVNCLCGTLRNETGTVRFDGRSAGRPAGASAHAAGPGAQLPVAAAVPQHDGGRESARAAALHRQCAARDASFRCRDRPLRRGVAATGRAGRQIRPAAARPDADRDAQARTGPRHGGGAQAADRRRGDGRPVARRGGRHPGAAGAGSTSKASP